MRPMAARGMAEKLVLISVMIVWCVIVVHGNDIEVGGQNGWAVPPMNYEDLYNHWASLNRFRVGDTIYFKYKNDSVMVVTEEDYNDCNCTHPLFFSNNGNTRYQLDHAGLFYYVSGEAGHCKLGQKMIIKVLSGANDISPSGAPFNKAQSPVLPPSPPSGHERSSTTAKIRDFGMMASVFGLFAVFLLG